MVIGLIQVVLDDLHHHKELCSHCGSPSRRVRWATIRSQVDRFGDLTERYKRIVYCGNKECDRIRYVRKIYNTHRRTGSPALLLSPLQY